MPNEVIGLILAGGSGSRLHPFTNFTHKTLLPIYDRPVIDYALSTMRRAGIKDITIVANKYIVQISEYIREGEEGEKFHYVLEEKPAGVAGALELARSRIEGKRVLIYFSDNITNWNFANDVIEFNHTDVMPGAVLLAREVDNPSAFGVCVFDDQNRIIDILEKPKHSDSNLAIGGIYLFDESFYLKFKKVKDDKEFSISDITRQYIKENKAKIREIGETTWLDCGTPKYLLEASNMAFKGIIGK